MVLVAYIFLSIGAAPPPIIPITRDSPLYPLASFLITGPGLILPILPIALVPAYDRWRWRIVAFFAMLSNAGLLLLAALFVNTVLFIPMVGYIVSAVLVGYVLLMRRNT